MGQKIRPWVLEDFLGPKVTTPQIWGSAEISDTKKKFFYVSTKTMPNLKNVLQIVVEIDGGGRSLALKQDYIKIGSPCYIEQNKYY